MSIPGIPESATWSHIPAPFAFAKPSGVEMFSVAYDEQRTLFLITALSAYDDSGRMPPDVFLGVKENLGMEDVVLVEGQTVRAVRLHGTYPASGAERLGLKLNKLDTEEVGAIYYERRWSSGSIDSIDIGGKHFGDGSIQRIPPHEWLSLGVALLFYDFVSPEIVLA